MLAFLKDYYIFMLILLIFSYLVPKEEYKRYIQFFIGIFVVVLFLKPVLEFFTMDNPTYVYEIFESFNEQVKELDYEYFFFEGKGE